MPSEQAQASRVAELADRLANRILVAFEQGALSTEEFRASPDVALVIDAARLLQAAGAEFPGELPVRAALRRSVFGVENGAYGRSYAQGVRAA